MRYILATLLLVARVAQCATGDFVGAYIETNGWQCVLVFSGMNTNGTYDLGWSGDNRVETPKLSISVRSQGYTGATLGTRTRTIYGTKQLRWPYPADAFPMDSTNGFELRTWIALSEPVYSADSNLVATVLAGIVNDGTASGAGSGVTVTNLSTRTYPKVMGEWTDSFHRLIQSSTMRLRAVAFHKFAEQTLPVAAAVFTARDSNLHTNTVTVTRMMVDRPVGDAVPFGEYVADMDISTFTQGDPIVCDVAFYPWIGNAASVLDTQVDAVTSPSVRFGTMTNVCDRSLSYGVVTAIVSTTGNDGTGFAATPAAWAASTNRQAFATIGAAMDAIGATNNAILSRGDTLDGGRIYLGEGSHIWTGAAVTTTGGQTAEWILQPFPGSSPDAVIISSQATDTRANDHDDIIRCYNITFNLSSATVFSSHKQAVMESCRINHTGTQFAINTTESMAFYLLRCSLTNFTQGWKPTSSTHETIPKLMRGNWLVGADLNAATITCIVGNLKLAGSDPGFQIVDYNSAYFLATNNTPILYNNVFYDFDVVSMLNMGTVYSELEGAAVVQNVFEYSGTTPDTEYYQAYTSSTLSATNVIFWNNWFGGAKLLWGYNSTGSAAAWRNDFSVVNNAFSWLPIKTDTFAGESGADGARVGNWELLWAVGHWGNAHVNSTNIQNAGDFDYEFQGVYSWAGQSTPTNYIRFTAYGGWDGVTDHAAGGNYRLQSRSPLFQRHIPRQVLPFDIEGQPRSAIDPPGPYSAGSVRKGAFF